MFIPRKQAEQFHVGGGKQEERSIGSREFVLVFIVKLRPPVVSPVKNRVERSHVVRHDENGYSNREESE
jgi:hypothetical protein